MKILLDILITVSIFTLLSVLIKNIIYIVGCINMKINKLNNDSKVEMNQILTKALHERYIKKFLKENEKTIKIIFKDGSYIIFSSDSIINYKCKFYDKNSIHIIKSNIECFENEKIN